MLETERVLKEATAAETYRSEGLPKKIFRPQPKDTGIKVSKVGDTYILSVPELERMMAGTGVSPNELRWQLSGHLERLGVNKALEKAGIQPGNKVRCGELEWEW
jgi:GTP-binding protein